MNVLTKRVVIANPLGLHGRTSALLVEKAGQFKAHVRLSRDDQQADCSSILEVLTLACSQGTQVSIEVSGEDAQECMAALVSLIDDKFGEQ